MLFIKHNLNAESLNILSDQSDDIVDDIQDLTEDIQESVKKIDLFIATLN